MPNDLFDPTGGDGLASTPQLDPNKDYLAELVGEGKKFKDPTELAKGKAYSDAHIATLEATLNNMRQELAQRKTTEDLINRINQLQQPQQTQTLQQDNQHLQQGEQTKGLTLEDVQKLLGERDVQSQRAFNLNSATQKLREQFGDEATRVVDQKAQELGVGKEFLKGIAEQTPNVFLALFAGAEAPTKPNNLFNAPSPSSYRPQDGKPLQETWKTLNALKATDPNKYWSSQYQRHLMAAAEKAQADGRYEEFMSS